MRTESDSLSTIGFNYRIGYFRRVSSAVLLAMLAAGAIAQSGGQATDQAPATGQMQSGAEKEPSGHAEGLDQFKVKLVPPQSGRASATDNIDTSEASLMTAPAVAANLPAVTPQGRPVIGLVLEGGGAMGLAHIGVLQWLEEHHIPVDRLSGTSMGALVGGLYASGHSVEELKASGITWRDGHDI